MPRAALYLRVSRDATGEGLGVERQRQDCERLAEARGWSVTEVFTENDTSASVGVRPEFERLVELMSSGGIDAVVVWHIDRLLRKMSDLERVIDIVEKTGVRVATVSGDIDLGTDMGRMVGRIMASVARAEVERKSARQKRANKQKAEAGKPHGARRALGYEADGLTIVEDEAAMLRDMASKVIGGSSYKEVAHWLNDAGHRTAQGKLFYPITVRNCLMRKRYAAIREYEGVEYVGSWPPIFDRDTWDLLQFVIAERRHAAGDKPVARKYLLTGLLTCGSCGRPLNGATKRDHPDRPLRRTYACKPIGDDGRPKGCGGVVRGADPLEHFIREAIIYRLDSPDLGALLSGDSSVDLSALLEKRQVLTTKLDALADDYADDTLTKAAYKRAVARVEASLSAVNAEIDDVHHSALNLRLRAGESVRDAWERNDDGWRRQLVSMLTEKILVMPGLTKPFYMVGEKRYRFDPELVDIKWRV